MKAITFEEWWEKTVGTGVWTTLERMAAHDAFHASRVGMVPEDECVRLPKMEEYPEWATSVVLVWSRQEEPWTTEIGRVSRPTPAWTPKVGDAVFFSVTVSLSVGDVVCVGIVSDVNSKGYCAVNNDKTTHYKKVKPFDATKIGKPWDEI